MALNLMYITNRADIARIAERAGVDRIFVDLEYIGKADRQGGMDTVQSNHTVADVKAVGMSLTKAELLVRVNPIHEGTEEYSSSQEEIDEVISGGAKIVMLPYFKRVDEVRRFLDIVDGRAKTMLLVETPEAAERLDEILELKGIDCVHIGLNDLSLGYKMPFMFELLANGMVQTLCEKCKKKGIPYGFGGIAALGKGKIPAEMVIGEHYRLGSTCAILSRSFCDVNTITDFSELEKHFNKEIKKVRDFEQKCQKGEIDFNKNKSKVKELVEEITVREDIR